MKQTGLPTSLADHLTGLLTPDRDDARALRRLADIAWEERASLVKWPSRCEWTERPFVRQAKAGKVKYAPESKALCEAMGFAPDTLENGPAVTAFRLASAGEQIARTANDKAWQVHHIYEGEHPVPGWSRKTCHANKDPELFSHAGGLVAIHPAIHNIAHADGWFAWKLRAEAWERFEFDPDGIFAHWRNAEAR